jgi:flagellar FliJ protein
MDHRRFEPLLHLAANRVDDAAQTFAQSHGQLARQESRLGDLGRFASEYHAIPSGGTDATLLANRRAFAARVDDVARQQALHVEHARRQSEQAREALVIARRDSEALQKLAAARRAAAERKAEKRQQMELDDLATRRFLSGRGDEA